MFADTGCAVLEMTQSPNFNHKRYVNVNVLCKLLRHPSDATTRITAKEMEVLVTGIFQPCNACALGITKKVNVSKTVNKFSNIP